MTSITRQFIILFYLIFMVRANGVPSDWDSASSVSNLISSGDAAFEAGKYKLAVDIYSKLIQLNTNNSGAYYARSCAFIKCGRINEAMEDVNISIRIRPSECAYLLRGGMYLQKFKPDKAVSDFSTCIRYNPSSTNAFLYRANAYSMIGEYSNAIADYDAAIDLDSELVLAYSSRAYVFYEKCDYYSSITDYSNAIRLNPRDPLLYAARAQVFSKNRNYTNGIADCLEAIRLDTNCAAAYNNLAWLLAVTPEARLRNGSKAVEYARRACDLTDWKAPYCLGTLAAAYAEVGDFEGAVKWQTKSLELGLLGKDLKEARQHLDLYKQKKTYIAELESHNNKGKGVSPK